MKPIMTTHQSLRRGGLEVRWFYEPPRTRAVLVGTGELRLMSLPMPGAMFGVCYLSGRPASLHCFAAAREPLHSRDDALYIASQMNGWVCLGFAAARLIMLGQIDPITAYWNTTFQGVPGRALTDLNHSVQRLCVHLDIAPLSFFVA